MQIEPNEFFYSIDSPLDAVPAYGQMRAANLAHFAEYVQSQGSDPHAILARFDLDPLALADPDLHVSAGRVAAIFEYCSTLFDDALFGLRLAQTQPPEVFGCVTALCRAAPTLRSAIESMVRYIPVAHSPEADLELLEGPETAELRWSTRIDLGVNEQALHQTMLLFLKLLRAVAPPEFRPGYVQFSEDFPNRHLAEVEAIVGCRVEMGSGRNSIGFAARALDLPVVSANRLTFRLLGGYLARVQIANRPDIVERTSNYVLGALPAGHCSIERCADKLGISVRTLQARLASKNVSFSDLVEQRREQLARVYLRQTRMPLDEVAERLGYSEQTSFGRAFKRWTGSTPRKYRAMG